MPRAIRCTVSLLAVMALIQVARADDTVENPEYKKWAVWKVGAYATIRGESSFNGMSSIVTTTHKLKEITAEKLVLEVKTVVETNGEKQEPEPATMEILAREPQLPEDVRKQLEEQSKALAASYKHSKGKESLTVKGQKVDCEWVRTEGPGNDTKCWSSSQVPGDTVKSITVAGPLKSNMQLIDWKGEKK